MAEGARFSLLFALIISAINLAIGAVYGAIEGFYGGAIDLIMERISDILNDVPFIVVTSLFQLHLASKVEPLETVVDELVRAIKHGTSPACRPAAVPSSMASCWKTC